MSMELLAPAGGPEQLRAAVRIGADVVYLAGPRWGMRARAHNFDDAELGRAVAFAHAHDVAVHLTLNTLMYDEDIDELPAYLELVDAMGVDAAIVADLGALALVRRHALRVALHVSTQASVTNAAAAEAYVALGASRLVLARELTMAQIAELRRRLGPTVELEAFAHGAMCMAVSGRCLLSSALVGPERSASCGNCTQPCRWTWSLAEETRPNLPLPIEADERGGYLLSANDLCMLEHVGALADAGIDAIKVEGRNKGGLLRGRRHQCLPARSGRRRPAGMDGRAGGDEPPALLDGLLLWQPNAESRPRGVCARPAVGGYGRPVRAMRGRVARRGDVPQQGRDGRRGVRSLARPSRAPLRAWAG